MDSEICVIGGGPAGSTIARRLAMLGHDVCLIERSPFPRSHIGESLSPGILPLLEACGVRERTEQAGFLRPEQSLVRWSDDKNILREHFGQPGFQVDRGRFDQLLLDAAREAGVHLLQPAMASQPISCMDGWSIPLRYRNADFEMHARFVVDATGRRAVLPGRKKRCSMPTLALYAYWRNVPIGGPETRVEAGQDEWFWAAPLPDGTFNATVFIDPKRCTQYRSGGLDSLYRSLLAKSSLLAGCLEGEMTGTVTACDASSRYAEQPVDRDFIRVGEAAFCIDPLSSQGVQAAVQSGLQGAIVVHTILRHPENTGPALEFYRQRQLESVTHHRWWAAQFYAEQKIWRGRPFWGQRAIVEGTMPAPPATESSFETMFTEPLQLEQRLKVSSAVTLAPTPCVEDDIITMKRALTHPRLERPLVYLGAVEIAPLIEAIVDGATVREVISRWTRKIPSTRGFMIANWMVYNGILLVSGNCFTEECRHKSVMEGVVAGQEVL